VLGFHGCEKDVACKLLEVDGGIEHLKPSANKYDWLGNGVYFWENDPRRAWEFAWERHTQFPSDKRGHIRDPFVIGAVIDLGLCLNLTDRRALNEVRSAHQYLTSAAEELKQALPKNTGREFGARLLDRAVIETVHTLREYSKAPDGAPLALAPYDTVRSPFQEGDALYDGAGFQAKNHIQIAVRNLACIKGYFKPIV
jgi:hypothetical protein